MSARLRPTGSGRSCCFRHAHATFTHLETYLRGGDLLPGDGNHIFSVDLYGKSSWPHPAYEFATNENSPNARVAVRKARGHAGLVDRAWATDGNEREISVNIPELGKTTLLARPEEVFNRAVIGAEPTLLDPAGMDPSRRIAEILADIVNPKPALPRHHVD